MKPESMKTITEKLAQNGKLEVLGLDELPFDIKEHKDAILEILKKNSDTLVSLSLSRN